MRILTNGIQTLPHYHPWLQARGDFDAILDMMQADIICVQETKITRDKVARQHAILKSYDSFFSSNRRLPAKGYSGTAIFTKRTSCVPLKAEEGISGITQADSKTIPASQHVGGYPSRSELSNLDLDVAELRDLDIEGRATVVDLGLFVLINLYCPNVTNEERMIYKIAFNAVVEARVRALIKQGRQVMVVGDMNICSREIDHADPSKSLKDNAITEFTDTKPRQWFNRLIAADGILVDTTRVFHPNRKGMFTCWETRINARDGNYGTRIDYVLVTPGLMPWIKHGNIQADVKGSDHCPVYVDLHDEITTESGIKLDLWEQMNPGRKQTDPIPDPPHFAARFYPEFKQNLLSTFFNKPKPLPVPTPAESPAEELSVEAAFSKLEGLASQPDPPGPAASTSERPSAPSPQASTTAPKAAQSQPVAGSSKLPVPERPSLSQSSSATALQKGKAKANGQASIASFFSPPAEKPRRKKSISQSSASKRKKDDVIDVDDDDGPSPQAKKRKSPAPEEEVDPVEMMAAQAARAEAWSSLFANSKKETPLCKVHGEPCKQFEVKKPGPNKGRFFWLCSRPVGEGFREKKVNEHRCDHFEWDKAPRK